MRRSLLLRMNYRQIVRLNAWCSLIDILIYFILFFFFNLLDFLAVEGAKESSQVDRDICPYLICWWGRYWRGR